MIMVESMREALDVLNDVEKIYWTMKDLAVRGAFIDTDPYAITRELGEALGLIE